MCAGFNVLGVPAPSVMATLVQLNVQLAADMVLAVLNAIKLNLVTLLSVLYASLAYSLTLKPRNFF